ncbi:MAG: carboxypeptidase regulatory-like domain-containing protein [Acidimicrobiia bacterium]
MRFGQLGQERRRWRLAFSAVLIVVPVVLATIPAAAAPSGTGSISGRVVDGNGNPRSGICVDIENGPGVQSDVAGMYAITGLDTGAYKVRFRDCNPTPHFLEQWYLNRPDSGSADPISVTDGVDTPLSDVTLAPGVTVSGTVTDTNGTPLTGISVNVNPTSPGPSSAGTQTDADGSYTTAPLAPGDYKVQFADQNPNPVWAPEYWNQKPSWNTADTLTLSLADGPTHGGVDAQLGTGAKVEGTVTGSNGDPLGSICVDANVANNGGWDWIAGSVTAPDGTYSMGPLPATEVRVHFRDCQNGPYADQWYDHQATGNSSTPVTLAAGEIRQGVDAQLALGVSVSGTVTDENGNPIAGISVAVNPINDGSSAWGQTDAQGNYTTNALPPGTYRVEFHDWSQNPVWATQFWDGQVTQDAATPLTLTSGDGPVRGGIDASLTHGATVSGTVTKPGGGPAGNVCVTGVVDTANGPQWIANANTGGDGTYNLTGLPATSIKVYFHDCNNVGPYVDQWWNHQGDYNSADPLVLEAGMHQSGIDAQLAAAGQIAGTVTDQLGHPLEGICAQASTSSAVGGMARTDSNGHYAISLAQPGQYKVQWVDCNDRPQFAGQWWDHQSSAADASPVTVAPGDVVSNVDATLAPGAVGTISGKVTNLNGVAMTTACVVAYLPFEFARFAPINPDGTFTIAGVPSGTYALAFLGCGGGGDPSPVVQDPQSQVTSYQAVWWKGASVELKNGQGGPDPIAEGADLVSIQPGQDLTGYDWCFGCTAISIAAITPSNGSVTFGFTTPGLLSAGLQSLATSSAQGAVDATATGYDYTVTCTSSNGGVTGTASGTGSPITVTGLTPGATYVCRVTASDGSLTVAASSDSVVVVAAANGSAVVPVATNPSSSPGSQMARTGADSAVQARLGAGLVVLGLVLMLLARSRRSRAGALA